MADRVILVFNAGSSTIKLGLFGLDPPEPRRLAAGHLDLRRHPLCLTIAAGVQSKEVPLAAEATQLQAVVDEVLAALERSFDFAAIAAVGHRVVHGGDRFAGPAAVTPEIVAAIEALVPLAPLHQPQNLRLIRAIAALRPDLPQVACFDTPFHRS